jgi:hypothetical protein
LSLTDLAIRKSKPRDKAFKLTDSGGLFLLVKPTGGKLWRYKFRFDEKEKSLALGAYPEISLQDARKRHMEAREQLAHGIDPCAAKQALKAARSGLAPDSFEVVAREWLAVWASDKTPRHAGYTLARL